MRLTASEFLTAHQRNMNRQTPFELLPFYRWLSDCLHPPGRLVPALLLYYAGHELKGCFSPEEIESYRYILSHFWERRFDRETVKL